MTCAALGQVVALIFFVVPVGDCAVDGDLEVLAGLVAGLFDGCDECLECVLVGIEVGSIAALIADAGWPERPSSELWKTSAHIRSASFQLFALTGMIMNSWISTFEPVACAPPLRTFIMGTGRVLAFTPPM